MQEPACKYCYPLQLRHSVLADPEHVKHEESQAGQFIEQGERGPQSVQSVPKAHMEYSLPVPPSSQVLS